MDRTYLPYSASSIANFFIQKSIDDDCKDLTIIKLLKLIYIAHGWSLALFSRPLISESIQAWKYGPVIESTYYRFREFADQPIDLYYCLNEDVERNPLPDDQGTRELLNTIWRIYKNTTGIQLANWTHAKEGAWYEAWHEEKGYSKRNHPISDENIGKYFKSLMEKGAQ